MLAYGLAVPTPGQERRSVIIVDARVLWTEPALEDDEPVWGLEIEDVIHGFVPGSVVVARPAAPAPEISPGLGQLLESRLGERVRVELRPRRDGMFDLVSAHALRDRAEASPSPEPPGLTLPSAREALPPASRSSVPRRVRSAAEDLSPEQSVVELVNQERLDNGNLPPLKRATALDASAEGHTTRMGTNNFFSHCDLDSGDLLGDRLADAGYAANEAAENIIAGSASPTLVMDLWMSSPEHQANILSGTLREIGVGYYHDAADSGNVRIDQNGNCVSEGNDGPYFHYWTQNFGRRDSVYPVVIDREDSSTNDQNVTLYVYGAGFATHMRFSNVGPSSGFSAWEPYSSAKSWTLSAGGGDKTVWAQLDANGNGTADHTASDSIYYDAACGTTTLENQELDGSPDTYQNCQIVAGPNVDVTGHTAFLANTVALRGGFTVEDGVELRIGPQP